ncbi:hypothetical protein J6590_020570 [Homalodisca vitripennis]|nr:hypothetical protein J6590_020570 [Homalodisca vitripennis]
MITSTLYSTLRSVASLCCLLRLRDLRQDLVQIYALHRACRYVPRVSAYLSHLIDFVVAVASVPPTSARPTPGYVTLPALLAVSTRIYTCLVKAREGLAILPSPGPCRDDSLYRSMMLALQKHYRGQQSYLRHAVGVPPYPCYSWLRVNSKHLHLHCLSWFTAGCEIPWLPLEPTSVACN